MAGALKPCPLDLLLRRPRAGRQLWLRGQAPWGGGPGAVEPGARGFLPFRSHSFPIGPVGGGEAPGAHGSVWFVEGLNGGYVCLATSVGQSPPSPQGTDRLSPFL